MIVFYLDLIVLNKNQYYIIFSKRKAYILKRLFTSALSVTWTNTDGKVVVLSFYYQRKTTIR
ncbi:MAG: hypothetical protein ABIR50_06685 [Ginsengibacter sp.]